MVVEAAVVLPLWILCLLGLIQLVLLQEARLLAEYAVFQAARAGVVWNGDPARMRDAAVFVLAPTACPTRMPAVAALCTGGSGWSSQAAGMAVLASFSAAGFPGVEVEALPVPGLRFEEGEADFDRVATSEAERLAGLLTVRLRAWYELKIPFADAAIWRAWRSITEAEGLVAADLAGAGGHYFVPIVAHHVMRMQSNPYERFVPACACPPGGSCEAGCGEGT